MVFYRELAQSSCFVYFIIIICIAAAAASSSSSSVSSVSLRVCTHIYIYIDKIIVRVVSARAQLSWFFGEQHFASEYIVYQPCTLCLVQFQQFKVLETKWLSLLFPQVLVASRVHTVFTSLHYTLRREQVNTHTQHNRRVSPKVRTHRSVKKKY